MIDKFKQNLTTNNLKFEEITDEVLLIKDFLTKEELDFVWGIINSASQEDWEVEYMGNLKNFCMEKLLEIFQSIMAGKQYLMILMKIALSMLVI